MYRYLWLLPLYFLLHNYNELFGFIPLAYLLLMALAIYGVAGIVFYISFRVTKVPARAAIITWCVLLLLLFWGAWHDLAKDLAHKSILSKYIILLPLTILLLVLLARFVFKRPAVAKYLGVVMVILCCMDLVSLVMHIDKYRHDKNLMYPGKPISDAYRPCYAVDSLKPDIYFIIFDGYTHNRTLQRWWQYDNHQITQWLQQRGFYLPDSSKANYSFTPYSISSVLNMNYLDKRKGDVSEVSYQMLKAVKSMSDNETFSILQKERYGFHFIGPFNNSFGDLNIKREFDHFAEKKLFNHTLPGRVWDDFKWVFNKSDAAKHPLLPAKGHAQIAHDNEVIVEQIKSTANDSANRRPQFVYGHLMITHKPHVYDSLGQVLNVGTLAKGQSLFDTYLYQVRKANEKIQELVSYIQAHNRKNTIIIIEGDHGFRDFDRSETASFFPNFCAFYFPNKTYTQVPANMSAVNTFRIVFNQYFCQNLKLLKDSSILVIY